MKLTYDIEIYKSMILIKNATNITNIYNDVQTHFYTLRSNDEITCKLFMIKKNDSFAINIVQRFYIYV